MIKDIVDEYCLIESERRKEIQRHELVLSELNNRLVSLQERCNHESIKHHPDASGNNDSWDQCQICDKEW